MAIDQTQRQGRPLILIGIVLAVVAAGLSYFFLSHSTAGTPPSQEQSVVVALVDIAANQKITTQMVKVIQLPIVDTPQNSYSQFQAVVGQTVNVPLTINQPIVSSDFAPATGGAVPSSGTEIPLPAGDVALAIPAEVPGSATASGALLAVGDYIKAGNYIDILVYTGGNVHYGFQNLEVVAVGAYTGVAPVAGAAPPVTSPTVFIVAVNRSQAEALTYLFTQDPSAVVKYVLRSTADVTAGNVNVPQYQPPNSTDPGVNAATATSEFGAR